VRQISMQSKEYIVDKFKFHMSPAISMYVVWVLLHYVSSHLYLEYCVGNSIYGFVMSIFYVSTPFCQGLSWIIFTGSRQMLGMWIIIGTYVSGKLLYGLFKKKETIPKVE
jgi:hypothetical protein